MALPTKQKQKFPFRRPDGYWQHKYQYVAQDPVPDWFLELKCFQHNWDVNKGGLGKFKHLKNACTMLFPDSVWHPWREERFKALCDEEYVHRVGNTIIRNQMWVGPGAAGKAQPLTSCVFTPTGPKWMGDIKVGDLVCTPDGGIAPVIGVFPQGPKEVFAITLSDGSEVRCCREHLWEVRCEDWSEPRVVDTDFLIKNHTRTSANGRIRNKFSVPFTKPVAFAKKEVPIPPYLMGALLGNGCFGGSSGEQPFQFSSADPETIARIESLLDDGYHLVHRAGSYDYGVSQTTQGTRNKYRTALRNYGLWASLSYEKFIPNDYLYNDVDTRLELLRGLLDTDGFVDKGCASFSSSSFSLSDGVRHLVQSLGGTARISTKIPFFTYGGKRKQGRFSFNVSIQFHDPSQLFHLTRKKELTKPRHFGAKGRVIVKIEPSGTEACQCILVDHPQHLYITNNFVPTHNTNDAGVFALLYWLCDVPNTIVVLTSTSKEKIRQRVWPVIQDCWTAYTQREDHIPGPYMLNSKTMLQHEPKKDNRALFAQAVERGEVHKALENIKGQHAPRMVLVIDEATGTEPAVWSVVPNMLKGCQELIVLQLGNGPVTHLDTFSRICTPVNGWGTITVDTERWLTKPVPEFQLPKGVCLHFDGIKSPNVKAGKTIYPFLYRWEDWERVKDDPIIQRSAMFWSQDRGFWPPEGFLNTVLSEELIRMGNAEGQVEFAGTTIPIGSLDPGFGGDRCVLRFGKLGKLASGKMAVQITERITIPILVDMLGSDGKKVPAEYQIKDRVILEASKRGVKPEYFGVEASGTGRGTAAVLMQEWGEIIWVESGGKPSELAASEVDPRPAKDVYDRKITELWYSVRAFVEGKQLGGLAQEDVLQFCARTYEIRAKKICIQTKEDLKATLGQSPDDADAVAILIEVARRHGMHTRGPRGDRISDQFQETVKLHNAVYSNANYEAEPSPYEVDSRW